MGIDEVKRIIFECGVVGAGGAGFPTHAKLNNGVDTIILNCAECEPLFRVDQQLLIKYTKEILEALSLIKIVLHSKKAVVAIKSKYKKTIEAVEKEIYRYENIEIKHLPDIYPVGDEVVLIYETLGRIVKEGTIPLSVGVVVLNVETVLNIYNAVFLNKPVTNKYITITGEVNRPITVKAPIGIEIGELIKYAGGVKINNYNILEGGPMTGRISTEKSTVTKTTKCIIILPEDHQIIINRKTNPSISIKRAMSICSQCRMCTDLCPRNLLGHSIKPHKIMNAISNNIVSDIDAFSIAMFCCECGLCEMYSCHQSLLPRRIISELKIKLKANGFKNLSNNVQRNVEPLRNERRVPTKRLISRIGVLDYDVDAPLIENAILTDKVEISLRQHIGATAAPLVKVGDEINKGQLIGDIQDGKIGSKIHSSIDGIVTHVDEYSITIKTRGGM
ncbi:electron transport complex protein RnfC [Caloramator sp. E03]|nr:electron transport complex protein RnfC [Caloramator sp. E03]